MVLALADWGVLAVAFVAGSTATLVPKILLRTPCDASCGLDPNSNGLDNSNRAFDAPVFTAMLVFGASILGLVYEAAAILARKLRSISSGSGGHV